MKVKDDQLVIIPESPFWKEFKEFGTLEGIVLAVNFVTTWTMDYCIRGKAGIFYFLTNAGISINFFLSIIGPLSEKGAFYLIFLILAVRNYLKNTEKSLGGYVKLAMIGGSVSVLKDALIHDPFHTFILWKGLEIYKTVPIWILWLAGFTIALIIVVIVNFIAEEIRFALTKKKLLKNGFEDESYLEARYDFREEDLHKAHGLFQMLIEKFELGNMKDGRIECGKVSEIRYRDCYWACNLPKVNNREPRLRFRQRDNENGGDPYQTVQVVFTCVEREGSAGKNSHHIKKSKFYHQFFRKQMPWRVEEIDDPHWREFVKKIQESEKLHEVEFTRTVARNPETILASLDRQEGRDGVILELKAFLHKKHILQEAMSLVISSEVARPTSLTKIELKEKRKNI